MDKQRFLRAVKAAGGARKVAALLNLRARQTLYKWAESGVPAERAADVERVLDIPRHTLRPDLWGDAA